MKFFILALSLQLLFTANTIKAQNNLVYTDNQGRMRWEKDKSEVYLFGVNYTVPFAYGYRSMKALNKDIEKEIDEDTYHMARIGVDGFRVHIWDTEISDSTGNLIDNEHLKLFDYLLYRLKQRNIKIIITLEAFYGDGYPQKDLKSNGFSAVYGKEHAGTNETAIKAQEKYIKQLLLHVNPYTKVSYKDEPFIIAAELNNEPAHNGAKSGVTAYINRLIAAARGTGWSKPLFYNISQNPSYADAVAKSGVNGFSFQWYPTGLVAGHEQKGNFLPNVDHYHIPFDTIPEFKNKARMVYEFDAADVLQSCIYPAVARSFKQAGFQWITQFAYDPMGSAYANTEYQTHYLNLAYTPPKAISYLIASRAFHLMPRKDYGVYPADSVFDAYHVSYNANMSEMNRPNEFYYSGTTNTTPVNAAKLQHIAGVGSSPVIQYKGYGAYFADKLESGVWRLEVMPDAITIRDPFAKPSPGREVVHIQWSDQAMQINLIDIGNDFDIKGINANNTYITTAANGSFTIKPGTYLLIKKGHSSAKWTAEKMVGYLGLNEFVAPQPFSHEPFVRHIPPVEVTAGKAVIINAKVANTNADNKVTLILNKPYGKPIAIPMKANTTYDYQAIIPAELVSSGALSYTIQVHKDNKYISFPGGHEGDPNAWDYLNTDTWQIFVAAPGSDLSLFNATTDREYANTFSMDYGRNNSVQFVGGEQTGQLAFKASEQSARKTQEMGLQLYIGNKIKNRLPEVENYNKIVVRARMQTGQTGKLRIALVNNDASAYAVYIDLSDEYKNIEIPLSAFKPDSMLSLPRPYPGFQALWFKPGSYSILSVPKLDKLEITIVNNKSAKLDNSYAIEVESIILKNN